MPERHVRRTKTVDVFPLEGGRFRLAASLTDMSHGGDHGDGPASSVIHDLHLTAVVAGPELTVEEIAVEPASLPYRTCPFVVPLVDRLVGKRLTSGWRNSVLELSGGTRGCTHVNTLLLGLSEMQAMIVFLRMNARVAHTEDNRRDGSWMAVGLAEAPALEGACFSLQRDSPAVRAGRAAAAGHDGPRTATP